jgi:hypothetical protein
MRATLRGKSGHAWVEPTLGARGRIDLSPSSGGSGTGRTVRVAIWAQFELYLRSKHLRAVGETRE